MKRTRFKPTWNNQKALVSIFYHRDFLPEGDPHKYHIGRWDLVCNLSYKRNYQIFCDENNEPFKQNGYRRDYDKLVSLLKD